MFKTRLYVSFRYPNTVCRNNSQFCEILTYDSICLNTQSMIFAERGSSCICPDLFLRFSRVLFILTLVVKFVRVTIIVLMNMSGNHYILIIQIFFFLFRETNSCAKSTKNFVGTSLYFLKFSIFVELFFFYISDLFSLNTIWYFLSLFCTQSVNLLFINLAKIL